MAEEVLGVDGTEVFETINEVGDELTAPVVELDNGIREASSYIETDGTSWTNTFNIGHFIPSTACSNWGKIPPVTMQLA
jgi:hypothetical protein